MDKLFLNVVFWGEKFRSYFLNYLVSSLLAKGNLPEVSSKLTCRFLIVTTSNDWEQINTSPIFSLLKSHCEVIWKEMESPAVTANKHLIMSKGHKWASQYTHEHNAYGFFLTPDLVVSNCSLSYLQKKIEENVDVLLVPAIRFETEGLLKEIDERFREPNSLYLELNARELIGAAINNLHAETKRYEYKSTWLADMPWSLFWRVDNDGGLLLHTTSWAPVLLNYAKVVEHDSSTFDNWTLDGDYVFKNFFSQCVINLITDTDDFALVSFTDKHDLPNVPFDPFRPRWQRYLCMPFFGDFVRTTFIRLAFHDPTIDAMKRELLKTPIFMHKHTLNREWALARESAAIIIEDSLLPPTKLMKHIKTSLVVPPIYERELTFWRSAIRTVVRKNLPPLAIKSIDKVVGFSFKKYALLLTIKSAFICLDLVAFVALTFNRIVRTVNPTK